MRVDEFVRVEVENGISLPYVIMKEIMKLIINIFKMIQTCRQPHKKLYMFMRKNDDQARYNGGGWVTMHRDVEG